MNKFIKEVMSERCYMILDDAVNKVMKEDNNNENEIEKKKMSPVDKLYERIEGIGINMEELKGILDCSDNQLILSGAGSGKTTALILKLIKGLVSGEYMKTVEIRTIDGVKRVQVPKKILVSTFLKTGAEELKASFGKMCKKLGISGLSAEDITFSTLHAEFYAALKEMGVAVDIEPSNQKILKTVLKKYNIKNRMSYSRKLTMDEIKDCECIVAYARNRLDRKRFEHPLMSEYGIDSIMLPVILEDMKNLRRATGKMDFEDLQELLYEYAGKNENISNFLSQRYDIILLDEFQDTAQIQYEVLKHYIKGCETVIAIGDDDQTIYSWRGSDVDIINRRFEEDFKPTVKQLTVNYRCAKNILNPVVKSIEKNKMRHEKELKGYHDGGTVIVDGSKSVDKIIKDIKEDIGKGYSVGILSRTNFDLLLPAILLELDGDVDFTMNKSISMNTRVCQQVFGVLDLVTKRYTPEFEEHLALFTSVYTRREAKTLADIIKVNKEYNIFNLPMRDIECSTPNMANVIKGLRDAERRLGKIEAYLYLVKVLKNDVYTGETPYAQKARDLCDFTINLIRNSEMCKDMDIGEISELITIVLPEKLRKRTNYNSKSSVKITTVHEAKGKEWDSVYIWNDNDGVFPASVGKRDLTAEEFEEERRVHYIAWTRAKKKLTIFTDITTMSPFLAECEVRDNIVMSEDGADGEDNQSVEKIAQFAGKKRVVSYEDVKGIVSKTVNKIMNDTTNFAYPYLNSILYSMNVENLIDRITEDVWVEIDSGQVLDENIMGKLRIGRLIIDDIKRLGRVYGAEDDMGSNDEDEFD